MYSYEWDTETGGFLLNSSPLTFSKEPRPVYYKELDILGFDKYWSYEKNDQYPYMWAEASNYWYRGRLVAKTKGGSLYTAPEIIILDEPEPDGQPLKFVDIPAMVEKNRDIMETLTQETIRKVYNTFVEYRNKVDVFYVAFSGGKDSVVALDIVSKALPHNEFKVLFGDTGMEFPDTYEVVEKTEACCNNNGIEFLRASSELSPIETWNIFGPPSQTMRWCCSVHKTAPQILKLREITGKTNFTGMAYVGVRASESVARSEYDFVSLGEKHKGQYSCNPILEWNSAELFLYIYSQGLDINETYKKGNNRAGCLVCPNVSEKNAFFRNACYPEQISRYTEIIKQKYLEISCDEKRFMEFMSVTGWKSRKNGRDINAKVNYTESNQAEYGVINVSNPKTNWKEWIKTIGVLINDNNPYKLMFRDTQIEIIVLEDERNIEVRYDISLLKSMPTFVKLLKNVFRKAACCVGCRECEADCHNGCLKISNGKVSISKDCHHCAQCHKVEKGCLVFKSLELPKGGSIMEQKSLNSYSTHAPKIEWINQYFNMEDDFLMKNSLGSQMLSFFKKFLRHSGLLVDDKFSDFAKLLKNIGIEEQNVWALMLSNLAYTSQVNWYIKNLNFDERYSKDALILKLSEAGANDRAANDICRSFTRFCELGFSQVGYGIFDKGSKSFIRSAWETPDPRVILYSLYKFAEACDHYYQFTLTRLLDHSIESNGISPTEIFGIGRDDMEKILTGLTINYPDFIHASFTLGLDNITLREDKKSSDVLELF